MNKTITIIALMIIMLSSTAFADIYHFNMTVNNIDDQQEEFGANYWNDLTNVLFNDGSYATLNFPTGHTDHVSTTLGFQFADIFDSRTKIRGIALYLNRSSDTNCIIDYNISLSNLTTRKGISYNGLKWSNNTFRTDKYGNDTYLWGTNFGAVDLNNGWIGFELVTAHNQTGCGSSPANASIESVFLELTWEINDTIGTPQILSPVIDQVYTLHDNETTPINVSWYQNQSLNGSAYFKTTQTIYLGNTTTHNDRGQIIYNANKTNMTPGLYTVEVTGCNDFPLCDINTTNYFFTVCKNNWVADNNVCLNNQSIITYHDASMCPEIWDVPANNGTYGSCTSQETVSNQIGLVWIHVIIWILLAGLSLAFFPLLIFVPVVYGILISINLYTTFGDGLMLVMGCALSITLLIAGLIKLFKS